MAPLRCGTMRMLLSALLVLGVTTAMAESPPLPRERPQPAAPSSSAEAPPLDAPSSAAESSSLEPPPETPPRIYQVACPALLDGRVTGKAMPPIHEGQCGIQSPLALDAIGVNGRSVPLSSVITTDCGMATALPEWLDAVDAYAFATEKTRIAAIDVATSYECRNVDHAATGNLSFHAFADALDVIGFDLTDGRHISIAPGYRGTVAEGSALLRFAHDAACAHFTTVLGPDADVFHQDNLHLDLACHGKRCTARLCQ